MQHSEPRSSQERGIDAGLPARSPVTEHSRGETHDPSAVYVVGMLAFAFGAYVVKLAFSSLRIGSSRVERSIAQRAGTFLMDVPGFNRRSLRVGRLPESTMAALRTSKMDSRHAHLNALMD